MSRLEAPGTSIIRHPPSSPGLRHPAELLLNILAPTTLRYTGQSGSTYPAKVV
jgi:hypothetical protein